MEGGVRDSGVGVGVEIGIKVRITIEMGLGKGLEVLEVMGAMSGCS